MGAARSRPALRARNSDWQFAPKSGSKLAAVQTLREHDGALVLARRWEWLPRGHVKSAVPI